MQVKHYLLSSALLLTCLLLTGRVDAQTSLESAVPKAQAGQTALQESQGLAAKGEYEQAQKKENEARTFFNEVVNLCQSIRPETISTYEEAQTYATTLAIAGEYDLAARGYERAGQLDPSQTEMFVLAGRHWRKAGGFSYPRALVVLNTLLSREELDTLTQSAVHVELGHVYRAQGLYMRSGEAYQRAFELDSSNQAAFLGTVLTQIHGGDLAEAQKSLAGMGALTPQQGAYLQKEIPTALSVMDANRIKIPETAQAHHAYATFLISAQRLYESLLAIEHAVMLDGSNYVFHNLRGGLLMQHGQTARAKASYTRSLELNPNQAQTRQILQGL